jgi:hypothetical protein
VREAFAAFSPRNARAVIAAQTHPHRFDLQQVIGDLACRRARAQHGGEGVNIDIVFVSRLGDVANPNRVPGGPQKLCNACMDASLIDHFQLE